MAEKPKFPEQRRDGKTVSGCKSEPSAAQVRGGCARAVRRRHLRPIPLLRTHESLLGPHDFFVGAFQISGGIRAAATWDQLVQSYRPQACRHHPNLRASACRCQ